MKMRIEKALLLALVLAAAQVSGQTFRTLYSFTPTTFDPGLDRVLGSDGSTNSDGASPNPGLALSGNTLYGTTRGGGPGGVGTVFALNQDGSGFTNLYNFRYGSWGGKALGGLVASSNTLFGTTAQPWGWLTALETVFAINTDGTGFTTLYEFTDRDDQPDATLILSNGTLYGTTFSGGGGSSALGNGTVFAVNTDGSAFTTLYTFSGAPGQDWYVANSDGAQPLVNLVLSGNTLYGMTETGGSSGNGTVFAVNTDGTGFTVLHSFTPTTYGNTNSDGANYDSGLDVVSPRVGNPRLVLSGNKLYGIAEGGGPSGGGTVFALNTDGTGFSLLHGFTAGSDVFEPRSLVISPGGCLYGTAGFSTVFKVNTDGTGFATFQVPDGEWPNCSMFSGNSLYGTTGGGGMFGSAGTIFSMSFPPELTITPTASGVILTWPTNYAGFDYTGYTCQSTTNLASSVWTAVSPAPMVVNGQNTVTNPISGAQQFYRLSQ